MGEDGTPALLSLHSSCFNQWANHSWLEHLVTRWLLHVVARVVPWHWSVQGYPGTRNSTSDVETILAVGFVLSKNQEYQQAAAKGAKKLEMKLGTCGRRRGFGRGLGLRFDTFGRITRHQLGFGKGRWNGHAFRFLSLTRGRLPAFLDSTSWYHRACMRGRLVWPCTANRDASLLQRLQLQEIVWL